MTGSKPSTAEADLGFREIIEFAPQGVRICRTMSAELVYANRALETIFGVSADTWEKDPDWWLQAIHREDIPDIGTGGQQILSADSPTELRIKRSDGVLRWITHRTFPIYRSGIDMGLTATIFDDITELKSARTEVDGNRSQLIQAEKLASIGILVNGLAHEINNPNHTIMATSAILAEAWRDIDRLVEENIDDISETLVAGTSYEDFSDTMPLYLDGLMKASERIRDIVSGLRDFARQDVYTETDIDLNSVTRDAIALAGSFIQRRTSKFTVTYNEIAGAVRGNPSRMQQVVINLIRNACQFLQSPDSAIRVSTGFSDKGRYAWIEVEDEGRGMSPEELKQILDPFYTTRRTEGGAGLGLSVSKSIVEDHGGTLHIKSEIGKGTRAAIHLPLIEESSE